MPSASPSPAMTPEEFSSAVSAITSAFGDPTRRDIYLWARQNPEGVTATAVSEHFELHSNVARHHLDKLAAGGYLEVRLGRSGGGAGRPSKRYVAGDTDMRMEFPVRRDDLLGTLLGRALALLPGDQAERLAEDVGAEYGRALADAMDPSTAQRSFKSAVGAVADALTSHGFSAHAEGQGNALRIVSEQCPFGHAAIEHPVLCALDRGLVRGMLAGLHGDRTPRTVASLPGGDAHCVTNL
jgi:predicted ArsR family transcriptional regulator